MTGAMHGITIRSIGITRAWFNIGITNLVYNFCRYGYLKRASAVGNFAAFVLGFALFVFPFETNDFL